MFHLARGWPDVAPRRQQTKHGSSAIWAALTRRRAASWQRFIRLQQHLPRANKKMLYASLAEAPKASKQTLLGRMRKKCHKTRGKEQRFIYLLLLFYFFCQTVPGRQPELNDSAPGQLRALRQNEFISLLQVDESHRQCIIRKDQTLKRRYRCLCTGILLVFG